MHVYYHTNGVLNEVTVGKRSGERVEIRWSSNGQMQSYAEILKSTHYGDDFRIWMWWYPNGVKAFELLPGPGGLPISRSWHENGKMEREEITGPEGIQTIRSWTADGEILLDGSEKHGSPWEGLFFHNYTPEAGSNRQVRISYRSGQVNGVNLGSGWVWAREWRVTGTNALAYMVQGAFVDYVTDSTTCAVRVIGNMNPILTDGDPPSSRMSVDPQFYKLSLNTLTTNDLDYLIRHFKYAPLSKFLSDTDSEVPSTKHAPKR